MTKLNHEDLNDQLNDLICDHATDLDVASEFFDYDTDDAEVTGELNCNGFTVTAINYLKVIDDGDTKCIKVNDFNRRLTHFVEAQIEESSKKPSVNIDVEAFRKEVRVLIYNQLRGKVITACEDNMLHSMPPADVASCLASDIGKLLDNVLTLLNDNN